MPDIPLFLLSGIWTDMAWPPASDFSAIVQQPRYAFRDSGLQTYQIERNALNQPRVWSGQFAVVYKGIDPQGRAWALRAFTRESKKRRNTATISTDSGPCSFANVARILTFDMLHHEVVDAIAFTGVMSRDDVRMDQFGSGTRFAMESLDGLG